MTAPHTADLTIRPLGIMAGRSAYAVTGALVDAAGTRHPFAVTLAGDAIGDTATGVVLIAEAWPDGLRVTAPDRYGVPFGQEWIRRFYGVDAAGIGARINSGQ
jgi:hypothetical protein